MINIESKPEITSSSGEILDQNTTERLRLIHQAVDKFPHFADHHKKAIGATFVLSVTALTIAELALNNLMEKHKIGRQEAVGKIDAKDLEIAEEESRKRPARHRIHLPIPKRFSH